MDENIKAKIQKVLDEEIRPKLQMDGGDAELAEVTDAGVVKVRLKGHCVGCPMAGLTIFMTVEGILKEKVPEVVKVESVA